MSFIRFAAWGSVDVEALDRMQRRNYLKNIRKELKEHGVDIDMGGQRTNPHYVITYYVGAPVGTEKKTFAAQGMTALKQVLAKALEVIPGEVTDHVSSEDGGVRGAGDAAHSAYVPVG